MSLSPYRWVSLVHIATAESYSRNTCAHKYVPFHAKSMAEPPITHKPIDLRMHSPPDFTDKFFDPNKLLHPDYFDSSSILRQDLKLLNARYCKVLGPREEFLRYLHLPQSRQLWTAHLAKDCVANVSVAAVPKRSGTDLRKILMVCPFNSLCQPLASLCGSSEVSYGMRGCGSLSQTRSSIYSWSVAALDESSAFTFVLPPPFGGASSKWVTCFMLLMCLRGCGLENPYPLSCGHVILECLWDTHIQRTYYSHLTCVQRKR